MDPTKYQITSSNGDDIASIVTPFARAWLLELALGGIGHQLGYPYLYRFSYWPCFLICVAAGTVFRVSPIHTWSIKKR